MLSNISDKECHIENYKYIYTALYRMYKRKKKTKLKLQRIIILL